MKVGLRYRDAVIFRAANGATQAVWVAGKLAPLVSLKVWAARQHRPAGLKPPRSRLRRQPRVVQRANQQIDELQLARPFTEVAAIQDRPLDLEHAKHVVPLPVGDFAALAIPLAVAVFFKE